MAGKILVVVSRFNDMVTRSLLQGAEDTLLKAGKSRDQWEVVWVPGAFEVPAVAAKGARSGKFGAVVALGCVIRGETPHFDFVAGQAASGLMSVSVSHAIPVIFGILTTDTVEQALNRSGLKGGNKGAEAAQAALEMMQIMAKLA